MSYRLKLIIIITAVPFLALLVMIITLAKDFQQDKIAYVYELQDETLRRTEAQLLKLINIESTWSNVFKFHNSKWDFLPNDKVPLENAQNLLKYSNFLCSPHQTYSYYSAQDHSLWLARCLSVNSELQISLLSSNLLKAIFSARSLQELILVHQNGLIIFSANPNIIGQNLENIMPESKAALESNQPTTKFESSLNPNEPLIGTYSPIPETPLAILSLTPKKAAQRAALPFLFKGVLILLIIIIGVLILSLFVSSSLVSRIKVLLDAFNRYGNGDQKLRLEVKSKGGDEFHQLNSGFNLMADHIQSLISDKEKSAANDHEMKLAGDVQKMFFPPEEVKFGTIEVQGFVWPASQCGGDWWYASKNEDKLIIILGDVTGHGFTSALMTSAGRAIVSKIDQKYTSLEDIAEEMSQALYSLSRGAFQMTFYGIEIDIKNNSFHILNCSHEPLFIQMKNGFLYNSNCHGARLGENPHLNFKGETLSLDQVQMLAIFSDGLRELYNPKGRKLGEVKLAKILSKSHDLIFKKRLDFLKNQIKEYQNQAPLQDDVCLVVIKP